MTQKNHKSKRKIGIAIGLTIVLILALTASVYLIEDFSISISSPSGTVVQGDTIQTSVFIKHLGGINASIALGGDAGSSGIQCSFEPTTRSPDFTSTLTMSVPKSTPSKNYSVIVTATAGVATHIATYTISVLNADVNVSGTITTDAWVKPTIIQFIEQQTGLTYNGSIFTSDSIVAGTKWNTSYYVTLQNQHTYNVTCYVSGIFVWERPFNAASLYVNAKVGSTSMTHDFSDYSLNY